MSHIFISYSRKDKHLLDEVIDALDEHGLNIANGNVWYDIEIKPSTTWSQEIDDALEMSDSLIVIITDNSIASEFVTYEWSYALGNNLPVFGLVFGKPKKLNFLSQLFKANKKIHPKLAELQHDYGITKEIIEEIQSKRITKVEEIYLNTRITTILLRVRTVGLVTFWFYKIPKIQTLDKQRYNEHLMILSRQINRAMDESSEFIIAISGVYSKKNTHLLRYLLSLLDDFRKTFMQDDGFFSETTIPNSYPKAISKWKNILNEFEKLDELPRRYNREKLYFELEKYLQTLIDDNEYTQTGLSWISPYKIFDLEIFEQFPNDMEYLKGSIRVIEELKDRPY